MTIEFLAAEQFAIPLDCGHAVGQAVDKVIEDKYRECHRIYMEKHPDQPRRYRVRGMLFADNDEELLFIYGQLIRDLSKAGAKVSYTPEEHIWGWDGDKADHSFEKWGE